MANARLFYLHDNPDIGLTHGTTLNSRDANQPIVFGHFETPWIGLQLYKGTSADAITIHEIDGTPEVCFTIKRTGKQTGEALVLKEGGFTWDSSLQAYIAKVAINTLQMRSFFAGKVDVLDQSGLDYTLVLDDAARLVARAHSTDLNVKIAKQADVAWSSGATIAVLNNSTHNLTVTGDTGVTLAGTSVVIAPGDLYLLTRESADSWSAAEADEADTVDATGEWRYRDAANDDWTYSPPFDVRIIDNYNRGNEAIPENTATPTAYATDAELTAEVASQIATQFGQAQGGCLPDETGAGLRGDEIEVDIVGFFIAGSPIADVTQTYDGNDLQIDLVAVDEDTIGLAAVYELRLEGSRYHTGGAGDTGGYVNAITIDTVDAFAITRSGDAAFTDRRVAYTLTATFYVSKTGATGKAHCMWELRETDGTTVRDYSSRSSAAASGDEGVVTFDTTAPHDLGIAARYLDSDGAADHSIPRAIFRRVL